MSDIVLAPVARRDLVAYYDRIARENARAARAMLEQLTKLLEMLASRSLEGPAVVLRDGRRVRRWSAPPLRIYYRRNGNTLEVVRLYHQARRPIELP